MDTGDSVVSAEDALYHLEEIDEILGSDHGDDQFALSRYLNTDQDLSTTLRRHDEELRQMCNAFIQTHVDSADNIGRLYREYTECEEKLVDFEQEIVSFQRKLEDTSEDIVNMQQQTDVLVRSINNRRQVSNKINEVYTALQECDAFCEEIASRDVDQTYLSNLRELEHKLLFLSKNKALQHSAVDNETRPKLTAAAHKAGDKLQRFLSKRILAMADKDGSELEAEQQQLEQSGQFAMTFLVLYNEPVARELTKLYVRTMSEVYYRQIRHLLRDFAEASELHASPLDPIVTAEEVYDVLSNRDGASPSGNQVNVPPPSFPARSIARRERSVSQHMRGLTDFRGRTDTTRALREATFDDTLRSVGSIAVRHGKLQVDAAAAAQLNQCNSWTWQFARCFLALVNTCVAECRFDANFFCPSDGAEGGENYSEAERIARSVLGRAVGAVETAMEEELPMVMERPAVLAVLRALEVAKQYLCTSLDPNPLLLLSGVLEMTKASLKSTLRTALRNDEVSLAFLPSLKLSPFRRVPGSGGVITTAQIVENKVYAGSLGPHLLVYRVCETLAQLEVLNAAPFRCSAFGDAAAGAYDPTVSGFLSKAYANVLEFVTLLARRHPGALAQSVFATVNVFTALSVLRGLSTRYAAQKAEEGRSGNEAASAEANHAVASPVSPAAPTSPSTAQATSSRTCTVCAPGSGYTALESTVQLLEYRLANTLNEWVLADAKANSTFADLFAFAKEAETCVGTDFFANSGSSSAATVEVGRLPPALSEDATRAVVNAFSSNWQGQLSTVVRNTRQLVQATLGSVSTPRTQATVQERCEELTQQVLRCYFQYVADSNAKLGTFVMAAFATGSGSTANEWAAKLVSNVTVLNEMQRARTS